MAPIQLLSVPEGPEFQSLIQVTVDGVEAFHLTYVLKQGNHSLDEGRTF
ncbi:MAG: hypothetical protein O2913_05470 [Chloroflexi bacterium]|nr:hypothetical protein [Chloroflexota bacterium]